MNAGLIINIAVLIVGVFTLIMLLREAYYNRIKISAEIIFLFDGTRTLKFVNTGRSSALIKDFRIFSKSKKDPVLELSHTTVEDLTLGPKSQRPITIPIELAFILEYEDKYYIEMDVRKRCSVKTITLYPKNIHGKSQNV